MTGKRPHMTLMRRIYLFLFFFAITLFILLGVDYYQNKYVLEPLERQTSNIYSISRFMNSVESILRVLDSYRWDYGDSDVLLETLQQEGGRATQHLGNIAKDLADVGEEQHLLARAADTTYITFSKSLATIVDCLQNGDAAGASGEYYTRTEPCGGYLRQYTQQLLEVAIRENQNAYLHTIILKRELANLQVLAVIGCIVLGAVLVVLMRQLLVPVRELALASQQIGEGNFDIEDVKVVRADEIGSMANAFNEMKRSMKNRVQLLNEKNEMERALHRRETEALEMQTLMEREKLQQLRSQINPHFLFNTLNVIQYTAKQEDADRTATLLTSLASLFRYTLASNEEQVPLAQEVRIIDSLYLLYHVRFGDRMRLEWRISPDIDLTETMVPSFLLQPLVENAFHHGLGPKESGGMVRIRINARAGWLYISVLDNGMGIAPEKLEALRANLQNTPTHGEHIGIYNVASRLRLMGEGCELKLYSREGMLTRAAMRLPLVLQQEEEETDAEDPDC